MISFLLRTPLYPFLALAIMFLLAGCLSGKTSTSPPLASPLMEGLPFASQTMSTSSYQQETKRWLDALPNAVSPKEKAEAHLHLAALYLTPVNPQKDYRSGYVELTKATSAWPKLQENVALSSWLELLNRVDRLDRLERESANANHEIASLENKLTQAQQKIADQGHELDKLRETLDKLKRLEMSVERKRRSFK